VPAAIFAAAGSAFAVCNHLYGASSASRVGTWLLFGTAATWLLGAVRYTVIHFRRR
jgi:hypothetical protein